MNFGYGDSHLGQIHYCELGDGDPLILLHQTAQSSDMWVESMPFFAKHFRTIAIDTPGFGDSDHPDSPPGMEGYAKAINEFMASIGVDRAHVCGHHTGAAMAVEFASTFPQRVNRLVLSGCPDYDPEVRPGKIANIPHMVVDEAGSHMKYAWDRGAGGYKGWGTVDMMHRAAVDALKAGPNYYFAYLAVCNQDVRTRIPNIQAETLLLSGSDDMFVGRHPLIQPLFKSAKIAVMDGVGALSMQQKPEEFAELVSGFLKNG